MDKKIFPDEPEIPILPNLFTAGNLVCGFFAILTIFEGINQADSDAVAAFSYYQNATFLIFAACLFDLFDGRIARMRGQDGPFGREFDSLADIVSFGIAPALLVAKAVLFQLAQAAADGRQRLVCLPGKIGNIHRSVLPAGTDRVSQTLQHGKVALGAVGQSGLHAGLGCFAQPVDVAAKPTETQRGFLRHAIPPLKNCLTAVNC